MESISEKLRSAREVRGLSLEQVERDTHISKRYIQALEVEDFDQLPGEAYLLGFLRSYAAYLGLDPDDVVGLYRNMQIQEQPLPMDELLDRKPLKVPVKSLAGLLLVVLLGGGIYLFLQTDLKLPSFSRPVVQESASAPPILLSNQFIERRFAQGDRVAVPVGDTRALLQFISIGDRVALGSEAGIVEISRGSSRSLDITGEGTPDVRVAIREIYLDEDPPLVVARIDRVVGQLQEESSRAALLSEEDRLEIEIGQTREPSRERSPQVVASLGQEIEFPLSLEVLESTLVRYQVDQGSRQEAVYARGESLSLSASHLVRLWVSNAGNVDLNVAGTSLSLGRQGEVVALVFRRIADGDEFLVEQLPLY
ncbi:Helix-turn-helix domain-containing protein [Alkalispirochaeta americana]|uniref:Helix-turn-helix domain-containing protein n=1 Tax=Alkalispirochaeta americana TaxID=159291 RepID=A0A1N6RE37_9SPIO|nr:helix-turn-helix transcriptional regulator [Alkalispirochaeta americana]SIQ27059.1 Helix-turn-helix domain-containing protein [Alkalispirochaeta americana]